MPISLHAAFVPTARQIVAATLGLITKAEDFCVAKKIAPEVMIGTRLIADMFDFGYQLKSVAVHSAGAIVGVRAGSFSPDRTRYESNFAAFRTVLTEAEAVLEKIDEAEMEGWIGSHMLFTAGTFRREFDADQFLLSFSLPNLHFHATTAYDILRTQGVAIGKVDFLGRQRSRERPNVPD